MATGDTIHQLELTFQNVLLAKSLTATLPVPKKLWRVLQAIALWEIWKARSQHYMAEVHTTAWGVIQKIWTRLCVYLKHFWSIKLRKVKSNRITRCKAKMEMGKEFGRHAAIWHVRGDTL